MEKHINFNFLDRFWSLIISRTSQLLHYDTWMPFSESLRYLVQDISGYHVPWVKCLWSPPRTSVKTPRWHRCSLPSFMAWCVATDFASIKIRTLFVMEMSGNWGVICNITNSQTFQLVGRSIDTVGLTTEKSVVPLEQN